MKCCMEFLHITIFLDLLGVFAMSIYKSLPKMDFNPGVANVFSSDIPIGNEGGELTI